MGHEFAPPKKFKQSAIKLRFNFKSQRVIIGTRSAELITATVDRQLYFILQDSKTYVTAKLNAISGKPGLTITPQGKHGLQVKLTEEAMRKMGWKPLVGKDYVDVEVDTLPRHVDSIQDCYLLKI